MISTGTLIDDKYEIVDTLGVGGFGAVYSAVQTQLQRKVAIKLLNTSVLSEADGLPRFEREAKAISALKHRNIVSFYGYGVWQQAPYMVMELVEGTSLDRVIATDAPMPAPRALNIIKQVLEGLQCAHETGVIHRDLKPANIILTKQSDGAEIIKIIDFGLAKLMPGYGVPGQKLTETGYALGTCHYMPPEQALGGTIDARADIYSAGCILYYMLSGQLPFDGDNNVAVMFQHLNNVPAPISKFLPPQAPVTAISTLIENFLAKRPDDRYSTAADATRDVQQILSGTYNSVTPLAVRPMSTIASSPRLAEKKLMVKMLIGAALLCCVTVGGLMYSYSARQTEQRESLELQNALERGRRAAAEQAPYSPEQYADMVLAFHTKPYFSSLSPTLRMELAEHLFQRPYRFGDVDKGASFLPEYRKDFFDSAEYIAAHLNDVPGYWIKTYKDWLRRKTALCLSCRKLEANQISDLHEKVIAAKDAFSLWQDLYLERRLPGAKEDMLKYFDLLCQLRQEEGTRDMGIAQYLMNAPGMLEDAHRLQGLFESVYGDLGETRAARAMAMTLMANQYLCANNLRSAEDVAKKAEESKYVDISEMIRGQIAFAKGDYKTAHAKFVTVYTLVRKNNPKSNAFTQLQWLARTAWRQKDNKQALQYAEDSVDDYWLTMKAAGYEIADDDAACRLVRALGLAAAGKQMDADAVADVIKVNELEAEKHSFGTLKDVEDARHLLSPSVVQKLGLK